MKTVFITGASGFLGYHLLERASLRYKVHGCYHQHPPRSNQGHFYPCDITNIREVGDLIDDLEPDAIIHTAAIADAGICFKEPALSYAINVEAAAQLAGIASDLQIPFVFTSTDLVFDGHKGNYDENDTPQPTSVYGQQKAAAEDAIQRIYPESLIARIPLLFGRPGASARSPFSKLLADLKNGTPVKLFHDEYRSMCSAYTIAEGLLHLMEHESGILHLCANERMSRYQFGCEVAKAFGLSTGSIEAVSQKEIVFSEPRPADVSMNCAKAIAAGYRINTIAEQLQFLATMP
ncbi:MAG: NAD(P)-dependent oxidoreductase [Chitinophagales bacterium]